LSLPLYSSRIRSSDVLGATAITLDPIDLVRTPVHESRTYRR